jgi:ribosomal protein S18 acetylase RimI-like enzyme
MPCCLQQNPATLVVGGSNTNHKLVSAIRLYEKFGFRHIPLINNKYLESDLKMVLEL